MTERTVTIDGLCPFLTCTEPIPHTHPVCPDCGAVRYGNLFCATCREHNGIVWLPARDGGYDEAQAISLAPDWVRRALGVYMVDPPNIVRGEN